MPATVTEVRKLIEDAFGSDSALASVVQEKQGRIVGNIVWTGFEKMDVSARNQLVTQRIRNPLGFRGLNVGILYPLAPGEHL